MVKIGIIGVGAMGTQHFLRLENKIGNVKVVAVSDVNEARAKELIAPYDGVRFIKDPIELIRDPEVEAIVIVSIDTTHEEFCLEAIKQKKYIFCEKPLSASAAGAKAVVDAEMAGGKRLIQMGFNRRFDNDYLEMKKLIKSGEIGEPLMAHCAHRNEFYAPEKDDVVAVTGTAIHEIDTMSWLVGDYFVKAQSVFAKKSKHTRNENIHDPQLVLLTTSSGMLISCEIWVNSFAYEVGCEVICDEGAVTLPKRPRVSVYHKDKVYTDTATDGLGYFAQSYDDEFVAWVNAIENDTVAENAASAWDGYCAAVTTDCVLKSQKSGVAEPVPLTETPDFYK